MKKYKAIFLIVALAVLTGIAALFHFNTRNEVSEGTVELIYQEENYVLNLEELEYEQVSGVRINGKGEEKPVEGQGISLKEVLDMYEITDYSKVTITSDDSYSAEVSVDEILELDKVILMYEEQQLRLIVFGDTNSKRSVTNVVQIVAE